MRQDAYSSGIGLLTGGLVAVGGAGGSGSKWGSIGKINFEPEHVTCGRKAGNTNIG
jgi:hypothetical protein